MVKSCSLVIGVAPLEADDLVDDRDVLVELGDVDPLGVDDRAVGVGHADDLAPHLCQATSGVAADVAVSLDGEGGAGDRALEPGQAVSRVTIATPKPVAASRPAEP